MSQYKVVLECADLQGSSSGWTLQRVATIYQGRREYRLYVPGLARGRAEDWFDQAHVRSVLSDGSESGLTDVASEAIKGAVLERLNEEVRESTPKSSETQYMLYHARIWLQGFGNPEEAVALLFHVLQERILERYAIDKPVVINGLTIRPQQITRIRVYETALPTADIPNKPLQDWLDMPSTKDVTNEYITTPKLSGEGTTSDPVEQILLRFHLLAKQLRKRHASRQTLDVKDEYDVQDVLHSLLLLFYSDVRSEEWTPSYAGKSARVDFLLFREQLVIEAKMTRAGLTGREVGDQLAVDIMRYKSHPRCKRLICFVYDPDSYISNPAGLEHDLSGTHDGISVLVIVTPQ